MQWVWQAIEGLLTVLLHHHIGYRQERNYIINLSSGPTPDKLPQE